MGRPRRSVSSLNETAPRWFGGSSPRRVLTVLVRPFASPLGWRRLLRLPASLRHLGLAVAFAVRGLKEFGEPARKSLIIAQAQPELRSRTYGAYYLIRDCAVTAGSFVGAALWSLSPRANFIGAAVCGAPPMAAPPGPS